MVSAGVPVFVNDVAYPDKSRLYDTVRAILYR